MLECLTLSWKTEFFEYPSVSVSVTDAMRDKLFVSVVDCVNTMLTSCFSGSSHRCARSS